MRSEGEVVGGLSGVSMLILPLQATRRPISDTSGFSTTLHEGDFPNDCVREICRENKQYLAYRELIGRLRAPWRHKKLQQRACIDSRMQYTSVASPCQTLRELLRE